MWVIYYDIPIKHENVQLFKQIIKLSIVNISFNSYKHILKCLDILLYHS